MKFWVFSTKKFVAICPKTRTSGTVANYPDFFAEFIKLIDDRDGFFGFCSAGVARTLILFYVQYNRAIENAMCSLNLFGLANIENSLCHLDDLNKTDTQFSNRATVLRIFIHPKSQSMSLLLISPVFLYHTHL